MLAKLSNDISQGNITINNWIKRIPYLAANKQFSGDILFPDIKNDNCFVTTTP